MSNQKVKLDKKLLKVEIVIGLTGTIIFFVLFLFGILGYKYWRLPLWAMIVMLSCGSVVFLVTVLLALRIEQLVGYYECNECHHRYIPTYSQVLLARHLQRSRLMKCPQCGKKSYHKKVISDK